jgi:hypothetical protein
MLKNAHCHRGRLSCGAQETRVLSDGELSLVDFLLNQISMLKNVVAHHGGVVSKKPSGQFLGLIVMSH